MNIWVDFYYIFMLGAALALSLLGLWFTAIIPGIDHWSKRFFQSFFIVFMLCCLSGLIESILIFSHVPAAAIYFILFLETLLLSLPLPMLTVYMLHFCGENMRRSRLMLAVTIIYAGYLFLLVGVMFTDDFIYVAADNHYYRGPLYPLALVPPFAIQLLNLAGIIKRRKKLSRKVFLSFLIAILPMTATLFIQMFIEVFPLMDFSYVLAALSMYGLILSDRIEQEELLQREVANQRARIMVLQMRPHFIYNTLMSIYSLCNLDPQKARQVTMDFTNYLRSNFNAVASEGTVPFSKELEHTRAYLAVEQAQHEEMLVVDYDTPFTQFRLPPLTLQPIVENSVKHGMNPYDGPLHITIRTYRTDQTSVIIVEDNGSGFDTADHSKLHTTLANIRQRLELMCDGTLEITSREGSGTVVTVSIPDRSSPEK